MSLCFPSKIRGPFSFGGTHKKSLQHRAGASKGLVGGARQCVVLISEARVGHKITAMGSVDGRDVSVKGRIGDGRYASCLASWHSPISRGCDVCLPFSPLLLAHRCYKPTAMLRKRASVRTRMRQSPSGSAQRTRGRKPRLSRVAGDLEVVSTF